MACSSSWSRPKLTLLAMSLTRATSLVRISSPVTRHHAVRAAPRHVLARDAAVGRCRPRPRPSAGRSSWPWSMARVVSSMSRTTPRRMPALRSTPTPRIRAPRLAGVARHLGDDGHHLGGAEIERRDQPLGLGAHARRPADDHLAGEAPIEFRNAPPCPGERLLHRHHRSNVLRGNIRAEPEAPAAHLEHHVRPRPASRRPIRANRSGSTSRTRASTRVTTAIAAGRDQRQVRRRAQPDRTAAPAHRASSSASPSPRLASATGGASATVDPQRARAAAGCTSAADHAGHRVAPGAQAARGSSNTLAVGRQPERVDHRRRIKILQSGDLDPPHPEERRAR